MEKITILIPTRDAQRPGALSARQGVEGGSQRSEGRIEKAESVKSERTERHRSARERNRLKSAASHYKHVLKTQ
jgi:hypothetical protein